MKTHRSFPTFSRAGLLIVILLTTTLILSPASINAGAIDLAPALLDAGRSPPIADMLSTQSAPVAAPQAVAVDCVDTTCPAATVSGLNQCVERANFCVYYTTGATTETEANWAADQIQNYWNRFTSLSFNAPKHSGKLQVHLSNNSDCNGGTSWSSNAMSTYAGCWMLGNDVAQMTLGHELTHRTQYAYDTSPSAPLQTKFLKEGTARASQDNWFTNIDHMPATAASYSYCAEAASYLAATNVDLSDLWYQSCVWWKWASEQYGTTLTEPERGVDFFETVYDQNTLGHSHLAAVNQALNIKAAGTDFNDTFRQFAVAAYTKDLSNLPGDVYRIVDEDEPGSTGACGTVAPANLGAITAGTDRQWSNHAISRYGIRYYEANIGASCPVITASFQRDGGPAFYHVVTQDGSNFKNHVYGSSDSWTQSFLNDGVTKVVAIVGSLENSDHVTTTLGCADPQIDIKLPNTDAKAQVQANTKFLAQVLVTNGSPTGPVVGGLTNSDFSAEVNGVTAAVTGGGFIQEQYWLVIRAPAGLADGDYDLTVKLEEPGTSTVIATDTNTQSVRYTSDLVDHVLVIDRSGSMGEPIEPTNDKLIAAKDAADFYVDITRNNDGLAVVAYHHDVSPTPFAMQTVNTTVRNNAKSYIDDWSVPNGIYPSGATSIGDGLIEARDQRVGSSTGNPLCSFILLSDGMENSERKWDSGTAPVKSDVQATGCPVTAIAFGPASNETLMQQIAQDTGGLNFYNDVYVSSLLNAATSTSPAVMTLDLANTYEYAQGQAEGRQRLLVATGQVTQSPKGKTATHEVIIDKSITEALFALDWYEQYYAILELELVTPDGTVITHQTRPYTFPEPYDPQKLHTTHVGWRIENPDPGTWKLVVRHIASEEKIVPYQVLVSGQTFLTLDLLLPDRLGMGYVTGDRVPIYAFLSGNGPITNVPIIAFITAPNGATTQLPLYDDGEHGDGAAGDGFYANLYTLGTQAEAVEPAQEPEVKRPPVPQDEGGYRVRVVAENDDFQREALGGFSVLEDADTNKNGLPDGWERHYGVSDANGDPDLDYLLNGDEYLVGTDPTNSDTDGGGENDGSEVEWGLDPLDPRDDQIEAPDFFQAAARNSAVRLTYDVKAEYGKLELWRAPDPTGPWNLRTAELPLTGVYTDTAANGETYLYRLIAEDREVQASSPMEVNIPGHRSAVLDSEAVDPRTDPTPPQAYIVINSGATSTVSPKVSLSFQPFQYEPGDPNGFDDIVAALISNEPSFAGAEWQPVDPKGTIEWQLTAEIGGIAQVYARFRDASGNESVGVTVDLIRYEPLSIYLPIVMNE